MKEKIHAKKRKRICCKKSKHRESKKVQAKICKTTKKNIGKKLENKKIFGNIEIFGKVTYGFQKNTRKKEKIPEN